MELTKEINYNGNLIQNNTIKIDYSGSLLKNCSEELYIVFGFDEDWKNTTYQKMDKEKNNFSASIRLLQYNELNFCFKDSNDNWDNNNYSNYTLKIETENKKQENSESNLNSLLDDILNETTIEQNSASSTNDSITKIEKISSFLDEDLEGNETCSDSLIADLSDTEIHNIALHFDSLLDEISVCDTISDDSIDLEKVFPQEFDFCVNKENTINTEIKENEVSSNVTSIPVQTEVSNQKSDESTTFSTQSDEISENSTLALVTTSKRKNIFDFDNLSPWYVLKKRIRLAFYKLIYVLPAFIFGEDED